MNNKEIEKKEKNDKHDKRSEIFLNKQRNEDKIYHRSSSKADDKDFRKEIENISEPKNKGSRKRYFSWDEWKTFPIV